MSRKVGPLVLIAIAVALQLSRPTPAVAAAAQIKDISPAAARRGERVTIKGNGFGAGNVRVAVGGVPAQSVAATGNQATFLVPPSAAPGPTQVTATNPGGHTGSIGFRVLDGILLPGNTTTPAVDAIFDLPPVGVDASLIENGIIMSRLDVLLAPDATVAQVNAALRSVGGGIVSMMRGTLMLTIAAPRQPTVDALQGLIATLNAAPGIRHGHLARTVSLRTLPFGQQDSVSHLLKTRFPAAWNASKLLDGCTRVPVLIPDAYDSRAPGFPTELPTLGPVEGGTVITFILLQPGQPVPQSHGYEVAVVLAGLFNETPPTGAHPFSACLDLRPVQLANISEAQGVQRLAQAFPAEKFVLSASFGFADSCPGAGEVPCDPATAFFMSPALERAELALSWKSLTHSRWNDFVTAVAAGNELDEESTTIYPGLGVSDFGSTIAVMRSNDLLFTWVQDEGFWAPSPTRPEFPTFAASSAEAAILQQDIVVLGLDTILPAENVLVVGSVTQQLADSSFSDVGADVKAVGEFVCLDVTCASPPLADNVGTSLSAPQVAGLAAYLWNLSPELRSRPAGETARAIRANTLPSPGATGASVASGVIDAYATILSLDAAALPDPTNAPIRKAILDLNNDRAFDHLDLAEFVAHYFDGDGVLLEPSSAGYTRFDLNGDGFTGGSRTGRFDLDRVGSTQFGAALYSVVTQDIEGVPVEFNESSLTDLQILCYYAYSALYRGDPAQRSQLLAGKCTEETATGTIVRTESGGIVSGGGCDPHTGGVYSDVLTVTVTVSLDTAGSIVVTDASGEEHMSGQVFLVSPCGIGTVLIGSVSFAGSVTAASFAQSDTQTGVLFVTVTGQRMNQLGETFDDTASHALPARIVSSGGRPVLLDFSHSSGGDGRTISISGSLRLSP